MFNNEHKKQFIESYDSLKTQQSLEYVFKKSEVLEEKLQKDISDFTWKEIETFFYDVGFTSTYTAFKYISILKSYSVFLSTSLGKTTSLQDYMQSIVELTREGYGGINNYVLKTLDDNTTFTRSTLHVIIQKLDNAIDAAIICLLFEGIGKKNDNYELRHLKSSDFNFNKTLEVTVPSIEKFKNAATAEEFIFGPMSANIKSPVIKVEGTSHIVEYKRIIHIDDPVVIATIRQALHQKVYVTDRTGPSEFFENDYFIRAVNRGVNVEESALPVRGKLIRNRLTRAVVEINDYYASKGIVSPFKSGRPITSVIWHSGMCDYYLKNINDFQDHNSPEHNQFIKSLAFRFNSYSDTLTNFPKFKNNLYIHLKLSE